MFKNAPRQTLEDCRGALVWSQESMLGSRLERLMGSMAMTLLGLMAGCATVPPPVQTEVVEETAVTHTVTAELSQTGESTQRSFIDRWNLEPRDPSAPWPVATSEQEESYYHVDARLLGDTVQIGGEGLHPAAKGRLITSSVTRDGLQQKVVTGRAGLSIALPLETASWLAILDLFRNRAKEPAEVVEKRGVGKHSHALQSQTKDLDSGGEAQTLAVMREVSGFRVSPDIECAAQVKIYGEQVVGHTAAQRARDHVDQTDTEAIPEWKQRQLLGLEARGRGQVVTRKFSIMRDGAVQYELQIHMSIEVDNDGGSSELRERAMQCRSSKPIFARELEGYWIEAREEQGYWAVAVQASEPQEKSE